MGKFDVNRRQFLGALSLGTAHLMFHNPLYGATGRFTSVDPLQRVTLGNTGIETTLLGYGTGIVGGNRSSFLTRQDKAKSDAAAGTFGGGSGIVFPGEHFRSPSCRSRSGVLSVAPS